MKKLTLLAVAIALSVCTSAYANNGPKRNDPASAPAVGTADSFPVLQQGFSNVGISKQYYLSENITASVKPSFNTQGLSVLSSSTKSLVALTPGDFTVSGNLSVGSSTSTISGYGSRLNFLGASQNGDDLWMSRYNNGTEQSELRMNIGDNDVATDRFVIGIHDAALSGAWSSKFIVQANGNVGIGITNPMDKLAVNGSIKAKEVKVTLSGWADFVFQDSYELLSLEQLEAYIKVNKHLPNIPSESQVMAEGLELGNINVKLLQKIEELTLYTIEQEKKIKEKEAALEALEKRLSRIEQLVLQDK